MLGINSSQVPKINIQTSIFLWQSVANAVSFTANKFKGKTDIMVIATMSAGGRDATLTRCSIQLWLHDDPVLDFVERHNVAALNVLIGWLSAEMILNQTVDRNKVIHNGHHNLHLLDAISNWNKF